MDVERGTMGRLPFAAVGDGPPLALLAGLSPTTGVEGDWTVRLALGAFGALAATRRVVIFNRRPCLPRGMTMAELAAEHADAIREGLGAAVDVIGVSTGGSIAQQLAADHPDVVDRLVLASTACRLGPAGRSLQRRVAARVRAGARRQALALLVADVVPPGRGQVVAGLVAFLLAPLMVLRPHDLDDLATTIEAEDAFDLAACDTPIAARTLILAGADDRFYAREQFEETARLIPDSDLRLLPGRGHITVMGDRGFREALGEFLRSGSGTPG